jgi:hypothetical protein
MRVGVFILEARIYIPVGVGAFPVVVYINEQAVPGQNKCVGEPTRAASAA